MSTVSNSRPSYIPGESGDMEQVTDITPTYPAIQANFGSSIWMLGRMIVETDTPAEVIMHDLVEFPNQSRSDEMNLGIITGDIATTGTASPELFWSPDRWIPAECDLGDQKMLKLNYRDFPQKHPDLSEISYRVAVVIEYIEETPSLEGLEGTLRERIYDDVSQSPFLLHDCEPDKYANDPVYSIIPELTDRIADVYNKETFVESILAQEIAQ